MGDKNSRKMDFCDYKADSLLQKPLCEKRSEWGGMPEYECMIRSGDICQNDRAMDALHFYRLAEDFEQILSLNLVPFYTERIDGEPFYKIALYIIQSCPLEIRNKYPLAMLQIAYILKCAGKDSILYELLNKLYPVIEDRTTGDECSHLKADWQLMETLLCYPNLSEMTASLKKAAGLFAGRQSRMIFSNSPWWFSAITPFAIFHIDPKEGQHESESLEEFFNLYGKLTGGHGAGVDILFRTEHAYYTGDFEKAEILAHKTIFIAQNSKQVPIRWVASFYLAWIAAYRGDSAGWRHAFDFLTSDVTALLRRWFVLPTTVDTLRALLLSELGKEDEAMPSWLREGDFSGEHLPSMAPIRLMVHLDGLLQEKSFTRLIGSAEALYPREFPVKCFGDVFPALITAAGYAGLGREEEALELISKAAAFLLPGEMYNQLSVYDLLTEGLVEDCVRERFPVYAEKFNQAKESLRKPLSSVYVELSLDKPMETLTSREREVALLARKGLHNGEIAKKLSISESTVRCHLRTVFTKLNIDRRSALVEKLL